MNVIKMNATNKHSEQAHLGPGNSCILLVHGILSSPRFFNPLISELPENVNYLNLLLPGHGTVVKEFANFGMRDWENYCAKKLAYLREIYDHIVVVGHSMGNLLLIDEIIKDNSKINGAVLIDVPLIGHITKAGLNVMLKATFDAEIKDKGIAKSVEYNKSIKLEKYCELPFFLPNFISLLWKMHQIRLDLPKMQVSSQVYQAGEDELVSSISNRYIIKNKLANLHIMDGIGHFYIPKKQWISIAKEIMYYYDLSSKQGIKNKNVAKIK